MLVGIPPQTSIRLPVDTAGQLPNGRSFADIREFKKLMLDQDEQLARNVVKQLLVYSTGAPVRFSDRAEIEKIVASTKSSQYGVRSLIHALVQSDLFVSK